MSYSHPILFSLSLADSCLILGQRNAEWCAHGPILEQDIAITNITLDLIGQARLFYQHAAQMILKETGEAVTEDSLAYFRNEREFRNYLICEQPNGDWAQTILRQFFFSSFQQLLFEKLKSSSDTQLSAIAAKSLKEVDYHVKWSSEWVIRLGDGTDESHQRMIKALDNLWMYTEEFFMPAEFDLTDMSFLHSSWLNKVKAVLEEATLVLPEKTFMQSGGRQGVHTEHLGYILTDLQYLQRTYPGAEW